jgi:hypothetical protein
MDAEPSTSEPAPKPKFTGPMDKYLSDKRVEAAVHATSVGTITRTKLAATASTLTLHAARKRRTAGLLRSVP